MADQSLTVTKHVILRFLKYTTRTLHQRNWRNIIKADQSHTVSMPLFLKVINSQR